MWQIINSVDKMAKFLKFFFEYQSLLEETHRVEIWEEGTTTDTIELQAGAEPFVTENNNDVAEKYLGGIVPTVATVMMSATETFNSSYFSKQKYGDYILKFRVNGALRSNAIITPFEANDLDRNGGYPITLSAECGLRNLKNKKYVPTSTRVKLISVLKTCLAQIGFIDNFPIKVIDNTKCYDGSIFDAAPIKYWEAYCDDIDFEGLNCYEVIDRIRKPYNQVFFDHVNGCWFVRNVDEVSSHNSTITTYNWTDLSFTELSYNRPTKAYVDRQSGYFGRMFSHQSVVVKKAKSNMPIRNSWGKMDNLTGWTFSGAAGLFYVINGGQLYNSKASFSSAEAVGVDQSYLQSPQFLYTPFQTFAENEKLTIEADVTMGSVLTNLRMQIITGFNGPGGIPNFLSTDGNWYSVENDQVPDYEGGNFFGSPIYEVKPSGDKLKIEIPRPPYHANNEFINQLNQIGNFGFWNNPFLMEMFPENAEYYLIIRIFFPERGESESAGPGATDAAYGLFIDNINIKVGNLDANISEGFERKFTLEDTQDRETDLTVDLGIGWPSYPTGTDSLFKTTADSSLVKFYSKSNVIAGEAIDVFVSNSYLKVLGKRLQTYQGTIWESLGFGDLVGIMGVKYRLHNAKYNARMHNTEVKAVELATNSTSGIDEETLQPNEDEKLIEEKIDRAVNRIDIPEFSSVNFAKKVLPSGKSVIMMNSDMRMDSAFADVFYSKSVAGGIITTEAEDTENDYTHIKPAANGTYALEEWVTANAWMQGGNTVTAEKPFGTIAGNFDIPILRNNVEVGRWRSGGLTVPALNISGLNVSQLTATDASKNIVSLDTATYPSLTELTYLKGVTSPIQTQLNAKANGSGTTNFVTKWSNATGGLTNSLIFDNGTNVGINNILPTYNLDITGTLHSTGNAIFDSNVGIGTISPATKLHVVGQVSASLGSLANPSYSFIGDLNTGLYSPSADVLALVTGGVNRLNISNVGDINIGAAAGTNSLIVNKIITGDVDASGIRSSGQLQSIVSGSGFFFRAVINQANYAIASIIGYESQVGTINGTGTNLINFRARATNAGFTNVYGFQSTIASGTNRYGAYFDGTAQNHFRGNVGIGAGSTVPTTELDVLGVTRTTNLRITNGAAVGKVWQCNNVNGAGEWVTPLSSERYIGEWAANSGVAPSASPTTGDYYVVNTAGTYLGITYAAGDEIYWNGTAWLKRSNFLTLPIATASVLGGIKIGTGLTIDGSGVVSVASSPILTTARTISATGDGTWSVSFNGSADVSGALTLADVATAGTYQSVTVNAKGLVTAGTNPTTVSGYGITDFYAQIVSGFVTGANSTVLDTDSLEVALEKLQGQINARISGNQTITLTGIVTGSGTTAITTAIADAALSIAKTSGLQTALDSKQATLSGTGLVLSTAGTITYVTNNSANWNTAFGWGNHASAGYLLASTASTTYQPLDADLTAIAALAGTSGILRKTALNTWSLDTASYFVTPTALTTNYVSKWGGSAFANSQIFDNGTNIGIGTTSPTYKIDIVNATGIILRHSETINTTGAFRIIGGSYTNNGMTGLMFNAINGINQINYGGGTGLAEPATQHQFYVGTYGTKAVGTEVMRIANSGFVGINTASPAYTLDVAGTIRTSSILITSGATVGNFLKCTNVNGTSVWSLITTSDISNLSSWAGSTSITTLGTITAGAWNGTTIATTRGGTGLSAIGTANQLLRVNAGATALEYFTPTFISGNQTISITGDATGSGTTSIALTLANVATAGTYRSVTINNKGLVTSGTNPTTLAGYAITDAYTKTESDGRFVALAGSYANPTWISSLAWTKLTGVPATFAPSAHTHAAVDIVSGVIATARLGSGTASATTFLRGDQTWATLPAPTLTSTRIGFGSGSDLLTSSANFAFEDDRIISIKNGGTSKIEVARFAGTNNYGLYVTSGNLELQSLTGGTVVSKSNHNFEGRILLNNLAGTAGQVLTSQGSGANPTWTTQDLDTVLDVGNTAFNKNIILTANGAETNKTELILNSATGISDSAALRFQKNGTTMASIYYDNEFIERLRIESSKKIQIDANSQSVGLYGTSTIIGSLSGIGTRMVVADATGVLSTQAIPSGGIGTIDQVLAAGNTAVNKTLIMTNNSSSNIDIIRINGVDGYDRNIFFAEVGLTNNGGFVGFRAGVDGAADPTMLTMQTVNGGTVMGGVAIHRQNGHVYIGQSPNSKAWNSAELNSNELFVDGSLRTETLKIGNRTVGTTFLFGYEVLYLI